MTPQLWTQFLSFQDWRLTHPDLTDQEATLLYKAELQLFQNYQDEIRNQTVNRQVQLTGDLLNLSADISTILNEGGADATRRYVLIQGVYPGPFTGVAVGRNTDDITFNVLAGDEFVYDFVGVDAYQNSRGTYKATVNSSINGTSETSGLIILSVTNIIQASVEGGDFEKISDSTTINTNVDF